MNKTLIYLDYAATTPVDKKVVEAMAPYFTSSYGNASSIHSYGQEATNAVDKARGQIAEFLRCASQEVVFTSGATESNNLSLRGVVKEFKKSNQEITPHVLVSPIEHDSVLETLEDLKRTDSIEVSYWPVDLEGKVLLEELEKNIKENTVLVSVMYANNEVGTIEPIQEIGKRIARLNQSRKHRIIFHSDAVQAAQYLECDVDKLGVDLLCISGHKIYGPKGISALYVRKGIILAPIVTGGGQEYGKRSGTLNVPAIVGLGQAVAELRDNKVSVDEIKEKRDRLIDAITKSIPDADLNGARGEYRLPNNVNFIFPGAEGESIVIMLDQMGIAASTGSACASKSLEPSHVLLAIGVPKEKAHASLRLTLGKDTTNEEIERVIEVLPGIVSRLREIAGVRVG